MERVKIDDETVWPDPTGRDFSTLAWRLRYAHDSLEKSCFYEAASVMEAYEYLVAEPTLTLEQAKNKIRGIRLAIKKGGNK